MAVLDDFLARIGGKGMPQTFGNSIGLGTPIDTYKQGMRQTTYDMSPTNIGLSGGVNAMNLPIQVGGGAMSNFGFTGMGMGAQPLTQPLTATRPRGFSSRLGDVFKDPRKFADLATGAALISGTPIAEAFAIRDALAPMTGDSSTVGTLYDVFDAQGNFIEQVSTRQTQRFRELQEAGFILRPTSETTDPTEYKKETGGALVDTKTGATTLTGTELTEARAKRRKAVQQRDVAISTANKVLRSIAEIKNLQMSAVSDPTVDRNLIMRMIDLGQSVLPGETEKIIKTKVNALGAENFKNVVTEMRAASPTGGALGSVSEKELAVFSAINYVFDVNVTGFGASLTNELDKFIADTIQAVDTAKLYASEIWSDWAQNMPEPDKSEPIPEPPILNIGESIDETFGF